MSDVTDAIDENAPSVFELDVLLLPPTPASRRIGCTCEYLR